MAPARALNTSDFYITQRGTTLTRYQWSIG